MHAAELFNGTKNAPAYKELKALLGDEWVSAKGVDRLAYSRDVWPIVSKQVHHGNVPYFPDIIVWPANAEEVKSVLEAARRHSLTVVPFAGGSGAVGGALPLQNGITLDIKRMDRILHLDKTSRLIRVEAGMLLQKLEDYLNYEGFTLGHYPQSIRSATVAGSIAHNGIGTFSTRYGKFDDMTLGMKVVIPNGDLIEIKPIPKRSTGFNLNELFLGSEGTLGIVTEATLKIWPLPEYRAFQSYAVSDMRAGLEIIREVVQHDLTPAVVRLYDEIEGKGLLFETIGMETGQCLLIFCFEGYKEQAEFEASICRRICLAHPVDELGPDPGIIWYEKKRFDVRHYIAAAEKPNRIADTLEVAATWDRLADLYYEIRKAMEQYPCRSMGHTSHIYKQGANLYMIFFAESGDAADLESLYFNILDATFQTCSRLGGTISHHHGVGFSKKRWMKFEHGESGMSLMRSIKKALDQENILNPGKLGLGE